MKYPCLVLDHDDTVVQSESTINYPYFCYILNEFRPGKTITLDEYVHGCCELGFAEMCKQWYAFTDEEMETEYQGWKAYIMEHIPAPFPGIKELILKQKELELIYVTYAIISKYELIDGDYVMGFAKESKDSRSYGEYRTRSKPFSCYSD